MQNPVVSVIIPTYQRNSSLERAITSVLNQTFKNFEIIIVDDNDENSIFRKKNEALMRKYENNERIVYLKHEKHANGAVARNTGICYSKAKYIAFLDDDDEFLQYKLEYQIKTLENCDESWGAVYCGYEIVQNNQLIKKSLNCREGDLTEDLLTMRNTIAGRSTILMKREILMELNGFDSTFTRHQDFELIIRFFRKYKVKYINQILVRIYFHTGQVQLSPLNILKLKIKFLKQFDEDIKKLPKPVQGTIYKAHILEISKCNFRYHQYRKTFRNFRIALSYSNLTPVELSVLILTIIEQITQLKIIEVINKILLFFRIYIS